MAKENKVNLLERRVDETEPDLMNAIPYIRQFPLKNDSRRIVTVHLPYAAFGVFLVDSDGRLRAPITFSPDAVFGTQLAVNLNGRSYFAIQERTPRGTGLHATQARAWHIRDEGMSLSWVGHDAFFPEINENLQFEA